MPDSYKEGKKPEPADPPVVDDSGNSSDDVGGGSNPVVGTPNGQNYEFNYGWDEDDGSSWLDDEYGDYNSYTGAQKDAEPSLVKGVKVYRKDIDIGGEDKYGHRQ